MVGECEDLAQQALRAAGGDPDHAIELVREWLGDEEISQDELERAIP